MRNSASTANLHGAAEDDENKMYDIPEWKKRMTKNKEYGRRPNQTIREQREALPIFKLKNDLMKAIANHQTLVVIGETGSGKTTQMTQYLGKIFKLACNNLIYS